MDQKKNAKSKNNHNRDELCVSFPFWSKKRRNWHQFTTVSNNDDVFVKLARLYIIQNNGINMWMYSRALRFNF